MDQEKLNKKTKKLEQILLGYKSIIIAYSGGVDSTFLTGIAHNLNGLRVLAVTSNSPSVASEDLFFAKKVAKDFKWNHLVIDTEEINNPKYVVYTAINYPKKPKESNQRMTGAVVNAPLVKKIIFEMIKILNLPSYRHDNFIKTDIKQIYKSDYAFL